MRLIHAVLPPMLARSLVIALLVIAGSEVAAQQVTVSTPFQSNSDSFFERIGTSWGFNWGKTHFSFGGPNMALPQFGGFDPSAGINSGVYTQRGDFNGYFNFAANQGFRQSYVSQTPSVTLMNGQSGFISDTSQSPFVIGHIPVVGGFPMIGQMMPIMPQPIYALGGPMVDTRATSPLVGNPQVQAMLKKSREKNRRGQAGDLPEPPAVESPKVRQANPAARPPNRDDFDLVAETPVATAPADGPARKAAPVGSSSAGRAVPSVAEARRLHELERAAGNNEARVLYEQGLSAEASGKQGAAKVYYRMAAKRATGKLQEQAQTRIDSLNSPSN